MKNRAQNCLTVSNLKLDDVFSDVFDKSSHSITEQILQHPGEKFDVSPFVHRHCKNPIEEIQAAVDGAISKEQTVKLSQCLDQIDELQKHISEVEQEILRLSDKYGAALMNIRATMFLLSGIRKPRKVCDWSNTSLSGTTHLSSPEPLCGAKQALRLS